MGCSFTRKDSQFNGGNLANSCICVCAVLVHLWEGDCSAVMSRRCLTQQQWGLKYFDFSYMKSHGWNVVTQEIGPCHRKRSSILWIFCSPSSTPWLVWQTLLRAQLDFLRGLLHLSPGGEKVSVRAAARKMAEWSLFLQCHKERVFFIMNTREK